MSVRPDTRKLFIDFFLLEWGMRFEIKQPPTIRAAKRDPFLRIGFPAGETDNHPGTLLLYFRYIRTIKPFFLPYRCSYDQQ
jgi:hypothetical protein